MEKSSGYVHIDMLDVEKSHLNLSYLDVRSKGKKGYEDISGLRLSPWGKGDSFLINDERLKC